MFFSLTTEHVIFFCVLRVLAVFGLNDFVTCPCSFWTKCHANLLVNNNKINNTCSNEHGVCPMPLHKYEA